MTLNGGPQILIPSKRFGIWSRLYRRFTLEPFPLLGSSASVGTTVVPVTDADELLRQAAVDVFAFATLAVGTSVVHTVPAGERWTWYAIDIFRGSGDRDVNAVSITDPINGLMRVLIFSATTSVVEILPQPLVLDEGWTISITITGGTTDGLWQSLAYKRVEDAF